MVTLRIMTHHDDVLSAGQFSSVISKDKFLL